MRIESFSAGNVCIDKSTKIVTIDGWERAVQDDTRFHKELKGKWEIYPKETFESGNPGYTYEGLLVFSWGSFAKQLLGYLRNPKIDHTLELTLQRIVLGATSESSENRWTLKRTLEEMNFARGRFYNTMRVLPDCKRLLTHLTFSILNIRVIM